MDMTALPPVGRAGARGTSASATRHDDASVGASKLHGAGNFDRSQACVLADGIPVTLRAENELSHATGNAAAPQPLRGGWTDRWFALLAHLEE